jgi:dCTP deaminase
MSTLTKKGIVSRLKGDGDAQQLVITPILSERQLGDASVDVRLANQFIVFRSHTLPAFDPYENHRSTSLKKLQERQVLDYGEPFILHPGVLALGATFEYISMPNDLECQVEGRSSWARLGLQIATATTIEPGFQGVVTLELSNVGTIPLVLRAGVRIAQLVFRSAAPPVAQAYGESRKYLCPIGPQFSRLQRDEDGHVFSER